jgi:hypothetical protein
MRQSCFGCDGIDHGVNTLTHKPQTIINIDSEPHCKQQHTTVPLILAMSSPKDERNEKERERLLRDPLELEASLLPLAQPLLPDESNYGDLPTAVPTGYFQYEQQPKEENVVCLPSAPLNLTSNDPSNTLFVRRAEQKGLYLSELEKEKIAKANRDVYSINYATNQDIEQANQRARERTFQEETGQFYTSASASTAPYTPPGPVTAQEFYEGTYGKEYEVAPYETGTYETSEYQVSDYKSVYEP